MQIADCFPDVYPIYSLPEHHSPLICFYSHTHVHIVIVRVLDVCRRLVVWEGSRCFHGAAFLMGCPPSRQLRAIYAHPFGFLRSSFFHFGDGGPSFTPLEKGGFLPAPGPSEATGERLHAAGPVRAGPIRGRLLGILKRW